MPRLPSRSRHGAVPTPAVPMTAARAALLAIAALAAPATARAFDPLALEPETVVQTEPNPSRGLRAELWSQHFDWRDRPPDASGRQQRVLLDLRREWRLNEHVRVGLSNRAERVFVPGRDQTRNALRELYAGIDAPHGGYLDIGRINWRNGVGSGFNPTDYLREGTVIEQGSQDPRALRENRLGTVMLRAQRIGAAGSVQLALIPSLASHTGSSPTAPGWSRSNPRRAALLKLSPTLDERTTIDVLGYARAGDRPRFGANLTHLWNHSLVLHAEASTGRRVADAPHPGAAPGVSRSGPDWVFGATWASPAGPVISTELQRDAAVDARALFVRVAWDRPLGLPETDIAAFVRHDLKDRGRLWQIDLAWHLDPRHSLKLLVGGHAGPRDSAHGAIPLRRHATLAWQRHF